MFMWSNVREVSRDHTRPYKVLYICLWLRLVCVFHSEVRCEWEPVMKCQISSFNLTACINIFIKLPYQTDISNSSTRSPTLPFCRGAGGSFHPTNPAAGSSSLQPQKKSHTQGSQGQQSHWCDNEMIEHYVDERQTDGTEETLWSVYGCGLAGSLNTTASSCPLYVGGRRLTQNIHLIFIIKMMNYQFCI